MAAKHPRGRRHDPTGGGKRAPQTPAELATYAESAEPVLRSLREGDDPAALFVPAGPETAPTAPSPADPSPADPSLGAEAAPGRLAEGVEAIAAAVRSLPSSPGVYRMLDAKGEALYVGKARNLKKRVYTYTQLAKLPIRLQRMVAETVALEIVRTRSEVEALLLESNLIKRLMPRFNVLLRDDKSFPYILITGNHDYPQIRKHRGAQDEQGSYFGPFASAGAVNRTVTALEKAFLLRSCSDAVFAQRTRPCLMYQIKRCSAPCVDRIDKPGYDRLVAEARAFLTGRSQDFQEEMARAMQEAAGRLDFEQAARYRDRLRALAHIQSSQGINVEGVEDADVVAAHQEGGQTCIQVFFFRVGRNYGNRAYFPSHDRQMELDEVLSAFLAQFYNNKPVPRLILTSHKPAEAELLAEALSSKAGRKVELAAPQRGDKLKLVEAALDNARDALARRMAESSAQARLLQGLADRLGLDRTPERIEVYDNSHIQGANPYGAMIVAGPEGLRKSAYRKFAIRNTEAGRSSDDYAMMREVLTRRFSRAQREDPERTEGQWPDLVLIDGGRGQLQVALEVLAELGIDDLDVAAVAKGPDRDAGRERIFLPDRPPLLLEPRDPVLYFIQRLRDEAHRFVIGTHRAGRTKARLTSALDEIPGIGAKRKKALLLHFGSARGVERASLADLEKVEGISGTVAKKIHDWFRRG
ncbi:Excinuclease ABC subunit C [Tistlia consotensis]|uniref:UvrABC system protein C n=1 Tax=Tistlia consotensis USBA 355 TaxID=560819 RepID=A0A1Y6CN12_9PROT|nr:excinuclease ABC subunit UvrC [Tistlia consotensis]SMF60943.1 Excinuclease ABC subunit C [Tistlia consotensis USBA 355]SNR92393.1 Excinuclease ABC subunit C [Tistlia consotensis]